MKKQDYLVYVPKANRTKNEGIGELGYLTHKDFGDKNDNYLMKYDLHNALDKAKLFNGVHVSIKSEKFGKNKVEMITIPNEEYLELLKAYKELQESKQL